MMPLSTTRRRFLSLLAGGAGVAAFGRGSSVNAAATDIAWLTWDANANRWHSSISPTGMR
jgi:hypothetical protein